MHKTDSCWRYGLQIPKKQPHSAGQTHYLTFRPGGSRRLSLKLFILSFPSDPKTKEHNVLLLFCVRARPLFFCLSVFNLARQISRTKKFPLILIDHFTVFDQYIITVYFDAIGKASKCCLQFLSNISLGWQAIASRFGKNMIMSAWLADY